MAIEVFNRREIKYVVSQKQFDILYPIIKEHMDPDKFNKGDKTYSIFNLYLDTDDDCLIRTSLEKPFYKQKVRLRSYGQVDLDQIVYLELKKKCNGIVNKRRTPMPLSEAYDYIEKKEFPMFANLNRQVFNEIDYIFKILPTLKSKLFLSYDRFAFFEKNNNDFRLTFDRNITTRRSDLRLDKESYGEQLLPPGYWVMEAKAFNSFPLWFVKTLSQNKIYNISFSKYGNEYIKQLEKGDNYEHFSA